MDIRSDIKLRPGAIDSLSSDSGQWGCFRLGSSAIAAGDLNGHLISGWSIDIKTNFSYA